MIRLRCRCTSAPLISLDDMWTKDSPARRRRASLIGSGDELGAVLVERAETFSATHALSVTSLKAFPSKVALVVSGHMHRFQAMGFADGRPPQLIVGTGGVAMSKTFPKQHHKDPFTFPVAGANATGVGLSKFGLLRIDVGKSGAWTAELQDHTGKPLADCT